jgi:hypothetical protein
VLAYVFWHRPRPGIDSAAYEAALASFHRVLAENAPPGFVRSGAFRLADVPWLGGGGPGWEDWYLLASFASLEPLRDAAVSGPRLVPHDAVARSTGDGAGGVFELVAGEPEHNPAALAAWLAKPEGEPYESFRGRVGGWVAAAGGVLWQRQLALGPGREFLAQLPAGAAVPPELGALVVELARAV